MAQVDNRNHTMPVDDDDNDPFTVTGDDVGGGGDEDPTGGDNTGGGGDQDPPGGDTTGGDTTGGDTTDPGVDENGDPVDVAPPPPPPPPDDLDSGGDIDLGAGNVPGAGDGPGAIDSSGTGNDPTPSEWDVTREQTVAGQLEDNYDRGSPFMEKAALEAERKHLASGGQNSLMAQKAGQMAAMDTAFKVSFADAATYARSAEFNAAMKNQFGLAEQRFIQNSLLSDQNFKQSVELQTQMIAGQLEGIRMDYEGRGLLLDKEFDQYFAKANYDAQLKEYAEMNGYQRQVAIQGVISRGNFLVQGFDSVMQYANNPNFTPEQARAAAQQGLQWMRETYDVNDSFWESVGSPSDGSPTFPYSSASTYAWWLYPGDNP